MIGAVREGQTLDLRAYARITGTKPVMLKRWIKAEEARRRAARAGLSDQFELLPEAVQAALQQVRMQAVFAEAARLAIDARLNTSTTKAIVKQTNAAPSEAEALLWSPRNARHARQTSVCWRRASSRHVAAACARRRILQR